ncbi:VPLPA-CTERM sorting domain-containing protein [Pseudomonas akapageensis]|uniref:VPLPA-CTERM sorting domain-containing protein n=1 Tax=Pseudomonas akapageensis TaxID=2609961 RepID=UPI00140B61C5|nr:VPLPA-CTERM sorting domain-containing protein [Pseudomonas akapageensis]
MRPSLLIKSAMLLILLNSAAVFSAQAASVAYDFSRLSNSGEDSGPQAGMLIEEGALFTLRENLGAPSSISDIYFDDVQPALFSSIDIQGTPAYFPGGYVNDFRADFSADSDGQSIATSGVLNNGINAVGEWFSFLGPWANASSFDGLIVALGNGQLGGGLHAKGTGMETTDSYLNRSSAVPLPAVAWLLASALLGFIVVANRRKV